MPRKTISVDLVKTRLNAVLRSDYGTKEYRQGIIEAMTMILHETENYKGFQYLTESEVPSGAEPGIRFIDGRPDFKDADKTRVKYS